MSLFSTTKASKKQPMELPFCKVFGEANGTSSSFVSLVLQVPHLIRFLGQVFGRFVWFPSYFCSLLLFLEDEVFLLSLLSQVASKSKCFVGKEYEFSRGLCCLPFGLQKWLKVLGVFIYCWTIVQSASLSFDPKATDI